MQFEPVGGFPPIIRVDDNISNKTTETRGFVATNIVNIGNIMSNKKKDSMFITFGPNDNDSEGGANTVDLDEKPYEYDDIQFEEF